MPRQLVSDELAPAFSKLIFALFVLIVPAAIGSARANFSDGDVSWHIAAGQWILANGTVPATDPFSFTMAGQPWVAFEWLSEVIYAIAFDTAGYQGLSVVVILAVMALHLAVFAFLHRRVGPIALVAAFVAMDLMLSKFVLARPHLLVWPILAVWTAALLDLRDKGRAPPLPLALLMLAWANLHGSFVLGYLVAGCVALDALIAARFGRRLFLGWLSFGLASLLAALVNANGIDGFLHPFVVMGLENLASIEEWRPSTPSTTPLFYAILTGVLGAMLLMRARLAVGESVLLLALLAMAFFQVRHQSWLAIVAPLILAPRLAPMQGTDPAPLFASSASRRAWSAAAAAAAVAILSVRLIVPIEPIEDVANPRSLIAHVPEELRSRPVLNEYSFGGPLILAGIRPYIDGRSDLYGDAFVADYFAMVDGDRARFDRAVRKYGIAWTALRLESPLAKQLDASHEWRRIYADKVGVIHVRR